MQQAKRSGSPQMRKERPMSNVIYKNIGNAPLRATGGAGLYIHGEHGKRYLDTCGGVAVSSLGHCHPRIVDTIARESSRLSWVHAGAFTTDAAEQLAQWLVQSSKGMHYAQFLSGGSEAMELGMKIAYQYHCETGQPGRTTFIARRQSYHGSTFATLAISGNAARRTIFEPLLMPAEFVSPCYAYRDRRHEESEADYVGRLADELEEKILEVGAGKIAAFVVEPVVGSTNGAVPALPGYLKRMQQVCARHGVLLLLDEVMAGMGRTGHPFAYLEDGVTPDIVAVGKGLAAGYMPISAVLITEQVHQAMASGSRVLRNGQTNVNHPLAAAIALEVQRTIVDDGLLANVLERGRQMQAALRRRCADLACVGDVRGRGLLIGVEFVADDGRQPLAAGDRFVAGVKAEGFRHGMLLYPGTGTVDGVRGNHVLFAPAFIANAAEIDDMVDRFADVIRHCAAHNFTFPSSSERFQSP
jgi:adenosylmethionine-8-amino-7-oxononanoate aminotransferase